VRQRLQEVCPYYPEANGMIAPNTVAPYNDYLFSCCTDASTCELNVDQADMCSAKIIERFSASWSTGCGAYALRTVPNFIYSNTAKKWYLEGTHI
jgi:hypothetical protein